MGTRHGSRGPSPVLAGDGVEATVAATLIGHHVLTMRLLEVGLLSDQARIVIAGSEAARGDVPMFEPVDIDALASERFDDDREAAIEALMRMDPPVDYPAANQYATVKMFAVWWAAELAQKLPQGMTVNAVSPGSTPDANAVRNAPFLMKRVLLPIFKFVPGKSHTVSDGAGRYLEAAGFGPEHTGRFFASKPKRMTGPLHEIELEHFDNPPAQQALWHVTAKVAGGVDYPPYAQVERLAGPSTPFSPSFTLGSPAPARARRSPSRRRPGVAHHAPVASASSRIAVTGRQHDRSAINVAAAAHLSSRSITRAAL